MGLSRIRRFMCAILATVFVCAIFNSNCLNHRGNGVSASGDTYVEGVAGTSATCTSEKFKGGQYVAEVSLSGCSDFDEAKITFVLSVDECIPKYPNSRHGDIYAAPSTETPNTSAYASNGNTLVITTTNKDVLKGSKKIAFTATLNCPANCSEVYVSSVSPEPTATPTPTPTNTPTPTSTPTPVPTNTPTPVPVATNTPVPETSPAPTSAPDPTEPSVPETTPPIPSESEVPPTEVLVPGPSDPADPSAPIATPEVTSTPTLTNTPTPTPAETSESTSEDTSATEPAVLGVKSETDPSDTSSEETEETKFTIPRNTEYVNATVANSWKPKEDYSFFIWFAVIFVLVVLFYLRYNYLSKKELGFVECCKQFIPIAPIVKKIRGEKDTSSSEKELSEEAAKELDAKHSTTGFAAAYRPVKSTVRKEDSSHEENKD